MMLIVALSNTFSDLSVESIFGGVVLLFVIYLIIDGRLRLEREVDAKDEIIFIKDDTIEKQRDSIKKLTERDEITHHLLKEIRDMALRQGGGGGHA